MARELKFRAWDGIQMVYQTNALSDIHRFFRVIRGDAIVMQFAGLLDKNGKEIYEGDILETITSKNMEVKYSDKHGAFFIESPSKTFCYFFSDWNYAKESKVIGNIYENPELLK